jgi:hypothetical protein
MLPPVRATTSTLAAAGQPLPETVISVPGGPLRGETVALGPDASRVAAGVRGVTLVEFSLLLLPQAASTIVRAMPTAITCRRAVAFIRRPALPGPYPFLHGLAQTHLLFSADQAT